MEMYQTALSLASDRVKDLAIATIACASNEHEVFIDIEDVSEGNKELPNDDSQECKDLLELVNKAIDQDAKMLHLV